MASTPMWKRIGIEKPKRPSANKSINLTTDNVLNDDSAT